MRITAPFRISGIRYWLLESFQSAIEIETGPHGSTATKISAPLPSQERGLVAKLSKMKKFNIELSELSFGIIDTLVHHEGNPVHKSKINKERLDEMITKGMLTVDINGNVEVSKAARFILFGYTD